MTDAPPRPETAVAPVVSNDVTAEALFANATEREPGLRGLLREYKPSVITGGASATPLMVLASLNAFDELDSAAFGLLLPEIRDYFGVSLGTILTVTSLAALMPILLAIPVGYLADRLPRTRMVGVGAATWGFFSMFTAFAGNLFMLGFARFGSGLGKTLDPAHSSLLADYYEPSRRVSIFSFHRFGNQVGILIAPTAAGILATLFFWQLPFLLFAIPSLAVAAYSFFVLKEPIRGNQERKLLGMTEAEANIEEKPPSWSESWRIAKGVRSLRRVWMALPFLVGAGGGIGALISVYYEEEYGLSAATRGTLASISTIISMLGILAGLSWGTRLLEKNVSRIPIYSALISAIGAMGFIIVAIAPNIWIAVVFSWLPTFLAPIIGPAATTLMTITIPARVRGFAISAGALFIAPGVLMIPIVGFIGDAYGIRFAIFAMTPIYLVGAAIIASAAPSISADVRAATAAAAASQEAQRSKASGQEKLLVVKDLDVHYGQVQILFNVDFSVDAGEIVALLGTNGAGKSTLLNAISGVTQPSNGAIVFDGDDTTFLPAADHVKRGAVMVPGGKGVFPTLTVEENLQIAAWGLDHEAGEAAAAMESVLETFPILRERLHQESGLLSGGQQQMLTLAQAFLAKPKLLMIDELSLGLAPAIVEQLLDIVRAIRDNGTTVILVEQSVNVALTISDRAVFMEKGEIQFSGPAEELLHRGDILRSVFLSGTGVGSKLRKKERMPWDEDGEVVLDVRGVTKAFGGINAVTDVDLTLRDGEVLGLIGPNGAGKTTLFDLISGYVIPDRGVVEMLGEEITELTPDVRSRMGMQRSFQDARLFPALTVEENLLYALDRHLSVRNPVMGALRLPRSRQAEVRLRKRAERIIMLLHLEPFRDKFVRELSTGSRRLVDLGCILATDPQILLLDEPSSGVAQKETEELGPLVQRIKTETACSILIIEHDMNLISNLSDELIALNLGQVVVRGKPEDVLAHPAVVESYLGTSDDVINRSGDGRTNGATR